MGGVGDITRLRTQGDAPTPKGPGAVWVCVRGWSAEEQRLCGTCVCVCICACVCVGVCVCICVHSCVGMRARLEGRAPRGKSTYDCAEHVHVRRFISCFRRTGAPSKLWLCKMTVSRVFCVFSRVFICVKCMVSCICVCHGIASCIGAGVTTRQLACFLYDELSSSFSFIGKSTINNHQVRIPYADLI